jgi:hypothetical protein
LVSGQPLFFTAIQELSEDLEFVMEQALLSALEVAREDLRSSARFVEGWSSIAEFLEVDWDGDGFVYFATGTADEVATLLEYGDGGDLAPTGFLRKIAIKQAPVLASIVTSTISEALSA